MKRRILILTTGGTIASVQSPDGLVPGMDKEQLRGHIPQIDPDIDIDIRELFHLDSSDMTAEHWIRIVTAIRETYDDYDGFVVCHGTDTMAYTAAVLSYMIRGSEKPIVLTGAQKPIGFEITDAKANLHDSILYAADPHSRGVQIVFAGKVIAGTRARKVRSMSFSAFASINLPEIAEINNGRIIRYITDGAYYRRAAEQEGEDAAGTTGATGSAKATAGAYEAAGAGETVGAVEVAGAGEAVGAVKAAGAGDPVGSVRFYDKINPNVFLLRLTPNTSAELIPEIFRINDAVIIESFGAGGIPEYIEPTLSRVLSGYSPEEKVLAMATQVPYEGSHLETYEVGHRISGSFPVLETRDMTLEATVAKLMWILGEEGQSWEQIAERFYEPVALDRLIV